MKKVFMTLGPELVLCKQQGYYISACPVHQGSKLALNCVLVFTMPMAQASENFDIFLVQNYIFSHVCQ